MKVLIDLNVLLDVIQRREPHYGPSARLLSLVADQQIEAVIPGHALTTIHYIVARFSDADTANAAIDWILTDFEVVGEGTDVMLRARSLAGDDFEDAVVAAELGDGALWRAFCNRRNECAGISEVVRF